jgi:SNF2 family DNA or RNA helicase
VRFWATASRLALEILARQRFLPAIEAKLRRRDAEAHWAPLLEQEHERIESLAAAMPPVCRAFSCGKVTPVEPEALLREFLTTAVDSFIRRTASRLRLRPRVVDTVGARFATALLEPVGSLAEPKDVIRSLTEELAGWKQSLGEDAESPFQITFRLEPPEEEETSSAGFEAAEWTLRYFLQAVDDPSLLIPLSQIWRHAGSTWRYLNRRMEQPQEYVLEGLGRASSLLPSIEESLKEPCPEYSRLTLKEAYDFLRETSFLLRESGFGILVPGWWGQEEKGFGLKLHITPARDSRGHDSGLGLDAIVGFDWQVALGSESLSREEFLKLVELKQPLVQVRGRWVELKHQQMEEALEVMRVRPSRPEMALREVLQLGLGDGREGKLPITSLDAEGWIGKLLDKLTGSEAMAQIDTPGAFRGELRPYQETGLAWLSFLSHWGLGACLADDMGLGKTIQLLALLLHRKQEKGATSPFLLISPTSVVSNWRKESERFAPSLRVLVHHGVDRRGGAAFVREAERNDMVISTYSLLHRDLEHLLSVRWGGLVLDEAQNIKNPAAKQTQALRRLKAPIRVALTGTPVENRLSELWSIMEFLNTGYLGSQLSFKRRFAVPIERYRDQEATEVLNQLVKPFVLRRLKTDPRVIKDLPEKNEMKVYCSLTREQATLYQAVVRESLKQIDRSDGMGRRGEILATLTRLKQVCNHPAHYLGDGSRLENRSGKLTRLAEMLEEVMAEGDQALVFTQYAKMGALLQQHLREILSTEVLFLHGGVPAGKREKIISRFQDDAAGPSIFVLSLKAGGFGLNLTRANNVFHFDRWWNPAVENQATDRVFRIGQTRPVSVYKYVCAGTVEEKIDELIESKKELAGQVIRGAEEWVTELSTANLRELFILRDDSVQD